MTSNKRTDQKQPSKPARPPQQLLPTPTNAMASNEPTDRRPPSNPATQQLRKEQLQDFVESLKPNQQHIVQALARIETATTRPTNHPLSSIASIDINLRDTTAVDPAANHAFAVNVLQPGSHRSTATVVTAQQDLAEMFRGLSVDDRDALWSRMRQQFADAGGEEHRELVESGGDDDEARDTSRSDGTKNGSRGVH